VTGFQELDELLEDLVAGVSTILGDDLVGAYLTGSFALGGADRHSDCDFLVVTARRPTPEQEQALRELHREIPTRPGYWPHNLEGSYAPAADLASLEALGEEWLFVDRGYQEMEWSTHCNTEDVRWTVRERGLTLAGPSPRELVAEVPADALRNSMRPQIERFLPDLLTWISFDNAWAQKYAVATLCRMLYTLETGEVTSKPAALEWGKEALASSWRDLVQQVLDDRDTAWDPMERPRPGSVEATMAFAEYAKRRAAVRTGVEVALFVTRKGGSEVLIVHRSPEQGGYWHVVAGGVEPGESVEGAALRELREETGLVAELEGGVEVVEYVYPLTEEPADIQSRYDDSVAEVAVTCFRVAAPDEWEPALDWEHDDHRWCAPSEAVSALRWPSTADALRRLLAADR
jgi:8-oxo-dGTP pyrophosphatase MutT (NUDIX family)